MITALWLLAVQGAFGAFDTLYYHEWRARLPALPGARPELRLHAARALVYGVVFAALPRFEWRGAWAYALAALLAAEVFITLRDFVVEDEVRKALGGVFAGERVTHALMAIIYGAMLANLLPAILGWRRGATALAPHAQEVPAELTRLLTLMAAGVTLSGLRDAYAALGLPGGGWPWGAAAREAGAEAGPGVVQVKREWNPPDEVVRQTEDDRRGGPRAAPDESGEADGAENLPRESDGGEQPAALGRARDLEIDDAVEADHHPEAGENLRVVLRRQSREAEEPLRVERRVESPRDVVGARRAEDRAVEPAARDHAFTPSPDGAPAAPPHGQRPPGSPSAA